MGTSKKDLYEIKEISAGKDQTLAVLNTGDVLGWGGAGSGRIAPFYVDICSSVSSSTEPVYISKPSHYSTVSTGFGISLGISEQQVYIWGFCQIGIGGKQLFSEAPTLIDGLTGTSKIVAGQFIYAAIDQAGSVSTWGLNVDSALGRNTSQVNSLPNKIAQIPPMQELVIGDNFMIALSKDQRVYGWGSNSAGQLGLGHLHTVHSPEPLSISASIKRIAIGSTHVLALSNEGKVFGWGSNHYGQLGSSRQAHLNRPTPIAFPEKITALAAGMHYSLALSVSGRVYAWGWNGFGQLGLGDLQSRRLPTVIPNLLGVRAIAAGEMHSLAIGKNHLLGWGNNESGQLGKAAIRQTIPNPILTIA